MGSSKNLIYKNLGGGIYEIETHYMDRRHFACCYLLKYKGDLIVIETSTNYAVTFILRTLEALGLSRNQVKYVVVTHVHLDHAGGAGELMRCLPEAELVIHPRGAAHMINPEKLTLSVKQIYGEEKYKKFYGEIIPVPENRVRPVRDSDVLDLGDRKLIVYETPGHAKHHIIIFDKNTRTVFSGDAFGISYPRFTYESFRLIFPSTSPTQFDPEVSIETYDKIMNLNPSRILLTHYGAFSDVQNAYQQLNDWIKFSVKIANKRYNEGFRDDELVKILQDDIWGYFSEKINQFYPQGLSEEEAGCSSGFVS